MVGIDLLIFIAKHWIDEYSFSKDVKKLWKKFIEKMIVVGIFSEKQGKWTLVSIYYYMENFSKFIRLCNSL